MNRLRLLIVCALAAIAVAGCGDKKDTVTRAETEGINLDAGGLNYQIQVSRILNPNDVEDRSYLAGLPEGAALQPGEAWFGVFLQVRNEGGKPKMSARNFEIDDTQGNKMTPLSLPTSNPFAYQPETLVADQLEPNIDSVAFRGATQGAMLLFKVKNQNYVANRPFTLHIQDAQFNSQAEVDLDL